MPLASLRSENGAACEISLNLGLVRLHAQPLSTPPAPTLRASPPMRMAASWFRPRTGIDRIQGCGAIVRAHWQARLRSSRPNVRPTASVTPCSPASRTLRVAVRWPAAILDPGCARRSADVRSGRRNVRSAELRNRGLVRACAGSTKIALDTQVPIQGLDGDPPGRVTLGRDVRCADTSQPYAGAAPPMPRVWRAIPRGGPGKSDSSISGFSRLTAA